MTKWINKQKVQPFGPAEASKVASPSSVPGELDDFGELFRFVLKCFRAVALAPGVSVRWTRVIVALLVLIAWAALLETFAIESRAALITGIANHIQFICNTIALTAAWVVPQVKHTELGPILEGFQIIDRELRCYRVAYADPLLSRRRFLAMFGTVVAGLALLVGYDGYVTFGTRTTVDLWYWWAHQTPFVVYALALLSAFVFVSWLYERFHHLNVLVEAFYRKDQLIPDRPLFDGSTHSHSDGPRPDVTPTTDTHLPERRELFDELHILGIVSRAIDLAQKIESFFGPLFLTAYTALFAVTTIQSYYCYLHVNGNRVGHGLTAESLALSVAIVVANAVAIVALPYVCERVETESKQLMVCLSRLSMKHGQSGHGQQQHSSVWFPNLISSVRFSALGFFNINYGMLSGVGSGRIEPDRGAIAVVDGVSFPFAQQLFAGIVTYLIIFVQFNSVVPAQSDDEHQSRKH